LPTGKPGKEGAALIEKFCAAPVPDVLFLVTAAEWSGKHDAAWSRAIAKTGNVVVLWPPRPHELPGWIARRLKSHGVDASAEAAALLAERIEGNLLAAAQEVDKLVLLQHGGRIDLEQMQALVADSARYDVFRLTDTALAGDTAHALRMLAGLRGEGEQVVPLLSWLATQVQLLARLAALQEDGGNLAQAMNQARLWESKQAVFKRALGRGSAAHFERLVSDCARIDRISKGRASGDAWVELERLVVGIARPGALARP
jgi:DNA polymerase-3 subunit delta